MRYATWGLAIVLLLWHSALSADWDSIEAAPAFSNEWSIKPFSPNDASAYYEAYQSSQRQLFNSLGWGWPTAKISPEMNTDTVSFHIEQHQSGQAFSYIIRDTRHHQIVGAIYISPVQERPGVANYNRSRYDAEVTFWLNRQGQENSRSSAFFTDLLNWLEDDWGFQRVLLPVFKQNDFTRNHYEALNLEFVTEDRENQELLYSFRAR